MEKGITIKDLLECNIFNYEFDLDEWPATHHNDEECLRPYNENMFMIRKHYKVVFPEEDFDEVDMDSPEGAKLDTSKVYKIKYAINLLPILGYYMRKNECMYSGAQKIEKVNTDVNILSLCSESDEIEMFEAESIQDLIAFKWD